MNCIVTGGAGFIGSHLVKSLLGRGDGVTIIDKKARPMQLDENVSYLQLDITDAELTECFKGADVVFHLAALTSVPESLVMPQKYHKTNVIGTLRILEAARLANVRIVVNSSSAAVYGEVEPPCVEDRLGEPLSPYALSKRMAEILCEYYHNNYGLNTISLRYFNVYGPGQPADSPYSSVIPKFVKAIKSGKRPTIFGNGNQTRDFVHVQDVVKANLLASKSFLLDGGPVNVASGKESSVNLISELIASNIGSEHNPNYLETRKGDIFRNFANTDRAKKLLNFTAEVEIKEGISSVL